MRAVLPPSLKLLPVGGITPHGMTEFYHAGASGFGLGSALYAPGMDADAVADRARSFVEAWQALTSVHETAVHETAAHETAAHKP
jgi:2-dehydro-3-deoxyphosphogalactonate aldolase